MRLTVAWWIAAPFVVLSGCAKHWEGYVYPGGIGKSSLVRIGMFNTFGECQRAAFSTLKELNSEKKGDYECGFACEGDLESSVRACKEWRK